MIEGIPARGTSQNPAYKLPFFFKTHPKGGEASRPARRTISPFSHHGMNIEVILSPTLYEGRQLRRPCTAVGVDVLRATTALCAMFRAGASEVVPLTTLEALQEYAKKGYVVAAERNGKKVEGATLGNSPTEYMSMDLHGARIAFSSTNGTRSIVRAADNARVAAGAFANLGALLEWIGQREDDLLIVCSGWKGDPSLEDTLFAGAIIHRLGQAHTLLNDAASMALDLYGMACHDVEGYCAKATHVHRLLGLGYANDIHFAFREDTCPVVPLWHPETSSLKAYKP